jgi:hypothetical protein
VSLTQSDVINNWDPNNPPPFNFFVGARIVADAPTVVTPQVTGQLGQNGWYVGDVYVHFDIQPAAATTAGCADQTVSTDTSPLGITFTCEATSGEGEVTTQSVTVYRDASPPTIDCGQQPNYLLGGPSSPISATVTDAASGAAQTTVSGATGTSTVGVHSVSLSASDLAGNGGTADCPYGVSYDFAGWEASVANPPVVNVVKAGWTVMFRWRLYDANHTPVRGRPEPGFTWASAACPVGATEQVLKNAGGHPGYRELKDDGLQLTVASPRAFAGLCKQARIDLDDGSTHTALFKFR